MTTVVDLNRLVYGYLYEALRMKRSMVVGTQGWLPPGGSHRWRGSLCGFGPHLTHSWLPETVSAASTLHTTHAFTSIIRSAGFSLSAKGRIMGGSFSGSTTSGQGSGAGREGGARPASCPVPLLALPFYRSFHSDLFPTLMAAPPNRWGWQVIHRELGPFFGLPHVLHEYLPRWEEDQGGVVQSKRIASAIQTECFWAARLTM